MNGPGSLANAKYAIRHQHLKVQFLPQSACHSIVCSLIFFRPFCVFVFSRNSTKANQINRHQSDIVHERAHFAWNRWFLLSLPKNGPSTVNWQIGQDRGFVHRHILLSEESDATNRHLPDYSSAWIVFFCSQNTRKMPLTSPVRWVVGLIIAAKVIKYTIRASNKSWVMYENRPDNPSH